MARVVDEARFRGRSLDESHVVHAVWDEVLGQLVEEFPVPTIPDGRYRRHVDGVFATNGPRCWHLRGTPLDLRDRDVVVCQAKAGKLDLGVLGQTLFAAELIEREHAPRSQRLIAAAVQPTPLIERLLESYRPFGRMIEHRTCPGVLPPRPGVLRLRKSSSERAGPALRQMLVSTLHGDIGGLLIAGAGPRGRSDFMRVRLAPNEEPLRRADPDAIILPDRRRGETAATTDPKVAAQEPVILVYTCPSLCMTAMGRAVFGGEITRRLFGLADVTSFLCYRTDNAVLRELIELLPHNRVRCVSI